VYELRKLDLFEVGPTLVGANQETSLIAAKSLDDLFRRVTAEVKAGRVLSASNEGALRAALDKIAGGVSDVESVLAAVADDGKATPPPAANPEAREGKGEERPGMSPASVRLLADMQAFVA
jgi:hypothetical protein